MTTSTSRIGGDVVAKMIQRFGVRTVFALAGASHFRLLDALDRDGVTIISHRHESAAVIAADGYSRITGKPGFALIIHKQGVANAVGGIANANDAASPVVVLVARPPMSQAEPGALEDLDALAPIRSITKWARTVHDGNRLGEYVEMAARKALAGRPGPVVLQIPSDLLSMAVDDPDSDAVAITRPAPPAADSDAVERAADLLAAAKRPLIIAGSGAAWGNAGEPLRTLAGRFGIPVMGRSLGRGLVAEDLVAGFLYALAQVAAQHADVVLFLGCRLNERVGFGRAPRFAADAQFIQIDTDAEEIGRNRHVQVGMVADAGQAARTLVTALERRSYRPVGDTQWIHDAMQARQARIAELGLGDEPPIHPYRIARELREVWPADAILVGDGADALNWFSAILRVHQAPGYLDHQPYGSMGVGTPLAVGAAAASLELAKDTGGEPRRVVLVTGDGSFGFYASELNGAALAGLPLVALISNDQGWGTERHGQEKAIGRTINVDLGDVRFDLVAQGYGCHGERVSEPIEVGPAIRRAFAAGRPAVLDFATDPKAGMVRKMDPRVQMVPHDDIIASRRSHHQPPVA